MNRDVELDLRAAAEDAVGERNAVAIDLDTDGWEVGGQVVGGVQADPAKSREQDINPGMGGIGVEQSWSSRPRSRSQESQRAKMP